MFFSLVMNFGIIIFKIYRFFLVLSSGNSPIEEYVETIPLNIYSGAFPIKNMQRISLELDIPS